VVVGDLIGTGDSQERGIVGETPNLAARLQTLAEPNSIVIGPRTHLLLPACVTSVRHSIQTVRST
jgi:class 3 adenylate cyclase